MIKKVHLKSFVAGTVVATMLVSTGAFGKTYKEQLDAVYNDIKIKVNGVTVTPKDVNGKTVDPFVVAGTTYLPVRALANALGEPVEWDAENNTVLIGTEASSAPIKEGFISIREFVKERPPYTGKIAVKDIEPFDVLQEQYSGVNTLDGEAKFLLKGDYKRLTGKFARPDSANDNAGLAIYVDGELVFDQRSSRGDEVVDVDIDLLGANELSIYTYGRYHNPCYGGVFFDVQVEPIAKK